MPLDHLGSPGVLLSAVAVFNQGLEPLAIGCHNRDGYSRDTGKEKQPMRSIGRRIIPAQLHNRQIRIRASK